MFSYAVGPALLAWFLVLPIAQARQDARYSIEVETHVDPLRFFPLCPGSRWTYQVTRSEGTAMPDEVHHYSGRRIVTDQSHHSTGWGTVVSMRIEHEGLRVTRTGPGQADPAELDRRKAAFESEHAFGYYLVRGNYVYNLPDRVWDRTRNEFTADATKYLTRLDASPGHGIDPEFFFPMRVGLSWAERGREREALRCLTQRMKGQGTEEDCPDSSFYFWNIESREKVKIPYGSVTAYFLTYPTLGGIVRRWFSEGVGIVRENYHHAGSVSDYEVQLLGFASGCTPKKRRTTRSSRRHEVR